MTFRKPRAAKGRLRKECVQLGASREINNTYSTIHVIDQTSGVKDYLTICNTSGQEEEEEEEV